MKRCSKCGETKSVEDFHKDSSKQDGRASVCRPCKLRKNTEWRSVNRDRVKETNKVWEKENKDKMLAYKARYKHTHQHTLQKKSNEYKNKKRKTDAIFCLKDTVRSLLLKAVKRGGWVKSLRTQTLLGCTFQELLAHLGQKPTENAHIDHLCPCAQAKNEQELLKLQHHTNLRWLPAEENLKKSDNKTPEAEEMCRKLLDREWID